MKKVAVVICGVLILIIVIGILLLSYKTNKGYEKGGNINIPISGSQDISILEKEYNITTLDSYKIVKVTLSGGRDRVLVTELLIHKNDIKTFMQRFNFKYEIDKEISTYIKYDEIYRSMDNSHVRIYVKYIDENNVSVLIEKESHFKDATNKLINKCIAN